MISTLIALTLAVQTTPPASAAPAAPADPGAAIRSAAMTFSGCVRGKIMTVPAALTPEAGADSVLAACAAEQAALVQAAEAQIALAPPEAQVTARQQMTDGMAQAKTGIAEGIRQMRAAQAAAPATPTPAPPPAPK